MITYKSIRELLALFDPNPERPGLAETPRRYIEAMEEWTAGYRQDPIAILKEFEDGAERYDEMVFEGGIPVFSLCEHHLTPFFGVVHIGYIPDGKIVGLSKLGRLADCFARRFQVQERLTVQIADTLQEHLKPKAVGVVARCRHMCMESRGLKKPGIITYTSALRGLFKESATARSEFMQFVSLADAKTTNL